MDETFMNHYIFGLHAVESLLRNRPKSIRCLYVQTERHDQKINSLIQIAKQVKIPIDYQSRQELDRLTDDANHQGIVADCAKAPAYTERDLPSLLDNLSSPAFILILDGVQDPHNLGACFRSADGAGVQMLIAPKDKAVSITPVVSKVASGATETIPFVQVTNLVRAMEILKEAGIWIYGAAAEAETSIFQTDLRGPLALVLGAEGAGLRRLTREHCDALMRIPMQGSVASLNVSVATAICLFEVVRQRFKK